MPTGIAFSTTVGLNRRARRRQRHYNQPYSAGAVTNINRPWETDTEEDRKVMMKRATSLNANANRFQILNPITPAPGAQPPILALPQTAFDFRYPRLSSTTPKATQNNTISSATALPAETPTPTATKEHTKKTAELTNITSASSVDPLTPNALSRINAALPDSVQILAATPPKRMPLTIRTTEIPLTNDGKSRFFPRESISTASILQKPSYDLHRTHSTKHRPTPLQLVGSFFKGSRNAEHLAPETIVKFGNVARKPVMYWGDQSLVRIETAGFMPEGMEGWMDEGCGSESGWEGGKREFWS